MKSPKYGISNKWINFIDLQQRDLSYTAIGIYVCCTASKIKEFSIEQLARASDQNSIAGIEFAVEELMVADLVEFVVTAPTQGGVA
jgi:hypothetical protein